MQTPDPRGFPTESPIHRLRYAIVERASHWSYDEKLATKKRRKPRVLLTDAERLAEAMKLLASFSASKGA